MKVKITVQVVEYGKLDGYKEVKKLMLLATKGIIAQHAGRVRGMGNNVWADFNTACSEATTIELEDEEEKKVEV